MLLVAILVLLQEPAEAWTPWKEGTSVTRRITTTYPDKVPGRTVVEERLTLLKVDGETATLKFERVEGGKRTHTAERVLSPAPAATPPAAGSREQVVVLDGIKLRCSMSRSEYGPATDRVRTTQLVCADSPEPGGLVQLEQTRRRAQEQLSVKEVFKLAALRDTRQCQGVAFSCWRTERTEDTSERDEEVGMLHGRTVTRTWKSTKMPGWLVRSEETCSGADGDSTTVMEVIAFDIRK